MRVLTGFSDNCGIVYNYPLRRTIVIAVPCKGARRIVDSNTQEENQNRGNGNTTEYLVNLGELKEYYC
ncbi:MAG: hypothetical protein IJT94_15180 [Oscillibacter sp.]|nr:hypothetical protein [Oscillibacter sp.]